jgi:SAM-dependent methyltransferase
VSAVNGHSVTELRGGFDRVADLYDRIRPTYPPELFEELFSRLPARPDVVEVGPGTGQATGALLDHHARVTAVELGTNMAERLGRNFAVRHDLGIIVSSFEDAVLPNHSFDALVSATAYHWVTGPARWEKPSEVLRPGGWVAIIDTIQVDEPTDRGFFERVQPIYDHYGPPGNQRPPIPAAEATSPCLVELADSPRYDMPRLFRYRWDQTYTTVGYADLMRSYSVSQAMPPAEREELIAAIADCVTHEFGGQVTRPLVITLTLARSLGKPRPG